MTIPAVMTSSEITTPAIAAGLLCSREPSHRMLSPMEMIGSVVVRMAWTGARNRPCWKASWLRMNPTGPVMART
jgi:hypothetical protein